MKRYNKPVVEIKGFEVEDIITASNAFGGDVEMQAVYKDFVGTSGSESDQIVVFEW